MLGLLFLAGLGGGLIRWWRQGWHLTQVVSSRSDYVSALYESTLTAEEYRWPTPWRPNLGQSSFPDAPQIQAKNALFVDLATDKVIYAKAAQEPIPIASLVKVMTAVLALEHTLPEQTIYISRAAAETPENFMGITAGETYTLEELLYGLILPSGNDAAEAIAEGVAGEREVFIDWMNRKAQELGMLNTVLANPSGLNDTDEPFYSTAEDLVILTAYALNNFPLLREIFAAFAYELPSTESHPYLYFENQTNLLTTYPGVKGVKTGYTEEAGLCLITYAENGGHQVLGVILGSTDRRGDAILLLDYSFSQLDVTVAHDLL